MKYTLEEEKDKSFILKIEAEIHFDNAQPAKDFIYDIIKLKYKYDSFILHQKAV